MANKQMAQMFGQLQQLTAVGESAANVPTESGDAETAVSSQMDTLANFGAAQDDLRCPRL